MFSFSPNDNRVKMNSADSPKKPNYNISKTKVKGEDYTRPGTDASQTEDDDLRPEPVEEDYEVTEDQKNPERKYGAPGIRKRISPTGVELEGIELIDPDVPEDTTPIVEDDAKKHGTKNKYRIGGDEGKRGTDMK